MRAQSLKYTILTGFLCLGSAALAQDKPTVPPPPQGTLTEEIEVVRPYKPILADAVKIRRNPDMNSEQQFKAVLTYNILDKKLDLNSNIKELQAQQVTDEQQENIINNYAKGAAGNFGTALGEVYLNTGRDQALQAGAFFRHLSQQGDQEKQQFSNQELGIFGRSIADAYQVSGRLTYDRQSTYFYGFNPVAAAVAPMDKQRFSTIGGQVELTSNYSENSTVDYALHLDAYHFSNIDDARESTVVLGGSLNKSINLLNIGINASADLTATKDAAYNMGNNFLRANPYIRLQGKGFELNLGANIVQEFGDNSRTNIFPAVSAELPVIPGYAIVFAGVNGDVLKSSLRDIAAENPYLNKDIAIKNSLEKMNVYGGVKGNVGAGLGYKISAFYKSIDDLMLYVNNPSVVNRFDVIYDNGNTRLLGLDGQLSIKASDVINVSGKAQLLNYELSTEKEAWFKPTVRLVSNVRAGINKKLFIDGELVFQGETYAKIMSPAPSSPEQTAKINGFMDLNAGAGYQINNKIGVFLRINNLLDNSYQKYLYYSKLGMNIFGGLNYSF